ncbi:hypothetical protein [Vibrio quintilis]|uniref:Uncharacterized protein n=1 Tax=Vibrio quintilis TaxID=1117707 RepID=A0A1M7YZ04_9VIBR|nr:hypothetical protein [Vibrio quintilis]SHO57815.1 hypothetical protein VQ7734_03585 [Vibrio quintilis]
MTVDEIVNYIMSGSRSLICITREKLERLDLFVLSLYIMGKPGAYVLSVEIDPIDMVDDGEGWIWQSKPMDMTKLINVLEEHLDSPLEDWENVTKSGHLSLCEEEIDNDLYQEQEVIFKNDLRFGEVLLPAGIIWVKRAD